MASFHRLELLKRTYRRDGAGASVTFVWKSVYQAIFGQQRLLFALTGADAQAAPAKNSHDDLVITCYKAFEDLPSDLIDEIADNGRYLWWNVKKNMGNGAKLWVGTQNGAALSFAQTRSGETIDVYFFPMTETCTLISHCVTLPDARGQGLYSRMLRHISSELGASGTSRVYIDCTDFNVSSENGIRAAGFHFIGRGVHHRSGKISWFQETPPSVSRLSQEK